METVLKTWMRFIANGRGLAAVKPDGFGTPKTLMGSQGNRVSLWQGLVRLECAERIEYPELIEMTMKHESSRPLGLN